MSAKDEKRNASKLTIEERIFLQLDELNVRMQKLFKLEESKIPTGKIEPETISVPPKGFIIDIDSPTQPSNTRLRGPWITINIANDGASSLNVFINDGDIADTLLSNENRDYNMVQRGKIRKVQLVPANGTSTLSVRFMGLP